MVLTVDIGDSIHRTGDIIIREGDSATDLAWEFCEEFGLSKLDVVGPLAEHIQSNMADVNGGDQRGFLHSLSESQGSGNASEDCPGHIDIRKQQVNPNLGRLTSKTQDHHHAGRTRQTYGALIDPPGWAEDVDDIYAASTSRSDRSEFR